MVTANVVEACAAQRFPLCKDTVNAHSALAEEAGVPELIRRAGLMYVYRDRAEFLADIPMSAPDTGARTSAALGAGQAHLRELRDMDTWADVVAIAAEVPDRLIAESARRWA